MKRNQSRTLKRAHERREERKTRTDEPANGTRDEVVEKTSRVRLSKANDGGPHISVSVLTLDAQPCSMPLLSGQRRTRREWSRRQMTYIGFRQHLADLEDTSEESAV